jgi:hypothetical protein
MPQNTEQQENLLKIGTVFAKWTFPEYAKHQHSRSWYFWFATSALGLLIYALVTLNFLFAIIIIVFCIIIFFHDIREPLEVSFYLGELGILLGNKVFTYKEFKNFWLIYEPPTVKNLYFEFKTGIRPRLSIPLINQNPLKIREFLLQKLEEDLEKEVEPNSEQLGRALKI